jgi:hypothetical protein
MSMTVEWPVVVVGVEDGGAALSLPGTGHRVVVDRDALEEVARGGLAAEAADLLHQPFGPLVVVAVGARGDAVELVVTVVPAVRGVLPGQVGEVLGAHVAAAAPGLVADAPELHAPRLVAPVGLAQPHHRAVAVAGQVLDPLAHLLDGAGADVAADVRLGAEQLAQGHELVGAEVVVLLDVAPVCVDHAGSLVAGADAVLPVVLVGETTAGPAQVGDVQGTQGFDDVEADAALVGNR